MIKCIDELEQHMADLVQADLAMEERMDKHGSRLYKLENLDIPHQVRKAVDEIVTDAVDWAIQAPLRDRLRDLPEADMKEILHHRMWETNSYKAHEDHKKLYEDLEKSMDSTLAEYTAWMTTDTRLKPSVLSITEDLHMDADLAPDEQVHSFDDEDIRNDHILKTGDMAIFMDCFCKKPGIIELTQKYLEGPAFEIVKVFHHNVIHLQYQMEECHKLLTDQVDDAIIRNNVSKPLPLGGQPGQVTIQADFFFNKDLEYLRYGSKGGRPALSISKMKAACYLDVGS
ncbi:hypothetical protein Tco_0899541 [Tanacetum coccineum]